MHVMSVCDDVWCICTLVCVLPALCGCYGSAVAQVWPVSMRVLRAALHQRGEQGAA